MARAETAAWNVLAGALDAVTAGWDYRARVRLAAVSRDAQMSLAASTMDLRFALDDIAGIRAMEDKKRRGELWARCLTPRQRGFLGGYAAVWDPEAWPACEIYYDANCFPAGMRADIQSAAAAWREYCVRHRPRRLCFDAQVLEAFDAGVLTEGALTDIINAVAMTVVLCGGPAVKIVFADVDGPLDQVLTMSVSGALVLRAAYTLLFAAARGRECSVRGVAVSTADLLDASACAECSHVYVCTPEGQMACHVVRPYFSASACADGGFVTLAPGVMPDRAAAAAYCEATASWPPDVQNRTYLVAGRGALCGTAAHWWDAVRHLFTVLSA